MLKFVNYDIVFQEIPDEVTLAINISNCPNHCPGCHSPYLTNDIGCDLTRETLDELLIKYGAGITCICFMGGDSDPHEVERLAFYLCRQNINSVKVGWYSGKSVLPDPFDTQWFHYIKLGPYIEHLGGLKQKNTNQRFYKLENNKFCDITYRFW